MAQIKKVLQQGRKTVDYTASLGTMGDWCKRIISKKARGSSATGKSKGLVPDSLARYMCRANRSHNHPLYNAVMASLGRRKGKK